MSHNPDYENNTFLTTILNTTLFYFKWNKFIYKRGKDLSQSQSVFDLYTVMSLLHSDKKQNTV